MNIYIYTVYIASSLHPPVSTFFYYSGCRFSCGLAVGTTPPGDMDAERIRFLVCVFKIRHEISHDLQHKHHVVGGERDGKYNRWCWLSATMTAQKKREGGGGGQRG
jgi:hypothetical protein